ncbi:MAG: carboxypeptidase-like regulatory domain-containing protein [Anaerolineae bacterium]|nr:carboxypeptidase-like regulatory domain-containing protein [Anaerolineae bacterium]
MRRAAALMILVAILSACTSSQSVPDAPPPAPVGDVLTLEASGRLTEQASLPEGPGNLSGTVRNMAGESLRNVLLYVDPDHMTLSAEDGSYRFDALSPGEHTVSALSHTHIDALEGQTAFIFDQADITRDFHLSEGLSTNVAVRFLNESDEPLVGPVGVLPAR